MQQVTKVIAALDAGEFSGTFVETRSRRRLAYRRTSEDSYHFRITRGRGEGDYTSRKKWTFQEDLRSGRIAVGDEEEFAIEDRGYVRFPDDHVLAEFACRIAYHAVRNNVTLEEAHGRDGPSMSDAEMKAFNIAVTEDIFAMLRYLRSPAALQAFLESSLPDYWQRPGRNSGHIHDASQSEVFSISRRNRMAR